MKMILKVLALPLLFIVTVACILGNLIKPTNKSQRSQQGLFCAAFSTTCKIGDIDGQHGKQAG